MHRKLTSAPEPVALVCGILEDCGRVLFLKRQHSLGGDALELPSLLITKADNPATSLASAFREKTGIDGQVHEVLFESKYNVGSRKRKKTIPVLCFRISAKNTSARHGNGFTGYAWVSLEDARRMRRSRNTEWL